MNYSYDDTGRLAQVQDGSGMYSFLYDNMSRLKQSTAAYSFLSGNPFTAVYGYDAASNRTSFADPSNGQTTYTYDTLNRLTNILDFNNNNFGFGYDALSRRTQLTRPNGIATNYGYDSVSNLLSVLHQQGVSTLDGASYTYDSAGNRKSKTNLLNSATSNFNYDNIYRLTGVTGPNPESYTYDAVGNRLTSQSVSNYAYNSSNELTAAGSASYTYDDDGNTATNTDSTGTTRYTWDFENRLTSVQLPNSAVVTFKYDPFGRRIQKNGTSTTDYVYDAANVIEEVDQNGNLLAHYSQGASVDEPLTELRSGTISYYAQDGLGTVTSLSSIGGTLANSYAYDSFGNLSSSSGTVTNPYQYTGRDYDSEIGLRYYRARYYDPDTGRFLSEDPIGFLSGGQNFYVYVFANPTNFRDPLGLQSASGTQILAQRVNQFTSWLAAQASSEAPAIALVEGGSAEGGVSAGPLGAVAGAGAAVLGGYGYYMQQAVSAGMTANAADRQVLQAIHNLNRVLLSHRKPTCKETEDEEECDKEWKNAAEYCSQLDDLPRNSPEFKKVRNLFGGSMLNCMRGQVSERCGGNKVVP